MKLLFSLSQIELTGAETYALSLAQALRRLGHDVVFVSEKLKDADGFKFYSLPLHTDNHSYWGRFKNVLALRKIMKEEKIDLVHSHSRAANLIAHFARPQGVPMVVSVHGRWRVHFAARTLPCLGERTIAICPYLGRYLSEEVGISPSAVRMIPNGIDTNIFCPDASVAAEKQILYVGRLSGQKGKVFRHLLKTAFPEFLRRFPEYKIQAVSTPTPLDLGLVEDFNCGFGHEAVKITDWKGSLVPLYRQAALVIGSGRVALEALACGKAVVSIGESSAPGLLSPETFEAAFDSNFGDCGVWNLFEKDNPVLRDIVDIIGQREKRQALENWGRRIILERFDSTRVGAEILKNYVELAERKKP